MFPDMRNLKIYWEPAQHKERNKHILTLTTVMCRMSRVAEQCQYCWMPVCTSSLSLGGAAEEQVAKVGCS